MTDPRNSANDSRLRSIRAAATVSLAFFSALLGWQLFVLVTGTYPNHILPVVKMLNGSQESVPIAYAWTTSLAAITVIGVVASLSGFIAMNLRLKRRIG